MATRPQLECSTEGVIVPVTIQWNIKNFKSLCSVAEQPPLESLVYSHNGIDLKLEVNRHDNKRGDGNYFSVKFCLVSCAYPLPLWACYYASIIKGGIEVYPTSQNKENWVNIYLGTYVGQTWSTGCNLNSYLDHGQLTIKCDITFTVAKHTQKLKVPECDLKTDFGSLLQDGKLSDVTLVAGGKTFPTHKAILSTRSPVFASMFEHDMKETATNEVNIADIEPSVLQEMLVYIYTGELSCKDHKKLFYAADKYQLNRLKVLCEIKLSKTLSVDNVTECLVFADLHEAKQLKEKCVRYIIHKRSAVMKTQGWSEVAARNDLLVQLFQAATI